MVKNWEPVTPYAERLIKRTPGCPVNLHVNQDGNKELINSHLPSTGGVAAYIICIKSLLYVQPTLLYDIDKKLNLFFAINFKQRTFTYWPPITN